MAGFESQPTHPRAAELASLLDLGANSLDRYSLMAAIMRCDEIVSAVRSIQVIHSQNLCRVANHLALD